MVSASSYFDIKLVNFWNFPFLLKSTVVANKQLCHDKWKTITLCYYLYHVRRQVTVVVNLLSFSDSHAQPPNFFSSQRVDQSEFQHGSEDCYDARRHPHVYCLHNEKTLSMIETQLQKSKKNCFNKNNNIIILHSWSEREVWLKWTLEIPKISFWVEGT